MVRNRGGSIASLLVVIVSMAFIVIFNNQSSVSANMVTTPIYASEDTTMIYGGLNAGIVYEDGGLGYLDVGYQGTYGDPLEVQVLLKFSLPPTPPGYEVETANLYIPVTGGSFQATTNFSLKVSTSTDHSWLQDSEITSPPAPTSGSTQTRLLASTVPTLKPTLAPFTFTSYISAESKKANPRATFILSGMTAQEAAQAGIQYADHYIQMTENHAGDGRSGPYLIITYSEIVNIEITGVTDGGSYNTNVTPQFNVGTATLNGNPFTSGTTVTAEGSYTLVVTSGGQQETVQFRIDKTPPTATVLINNGSLFANSQYVSVRITPDPGVDDIVSFRYSVNGGSTSPNQPYHSEFSISVGAANGAKSVSIELIDAAGNVSPLYFWNFSMNTTIPTGTLTINSGATFTTRQEVDLLITPDASANEIVSMRFSTDNSNWSSEESYSSSKRFTLPAGDGNKTVYVQLIDRFRNIGVVQRSILLDMTPPTAEVLINNGNYYTNNANVAVEITPDAGVNDIAFVRYRINGSTPTTIPYTNSFSINVGNTNEVKVIDVTLIDGVGNNSPVYSSSITLDTVAPTGTVAINGGAAYATTVGVTLSFTLGAGVTDVVGVQFSNDSLTWSAEQAYSPSMSYTLSAGDGSKTIYVRFIDRAGNIGTAQASIILDTEPPTGTLSITSPTLTNATSVTFTVTSSNADYMELGEVGQSYEARVAYSDSVQTYTLQDTEEDGVKTIQVRLSDEAGNTSVLTADVTLDRTAPTGTVVVNGGELYTNDANVTVEVTPATGVIDIADIRYTVNGTPTTIAYTDSFVIDVGNANEEKQITVELIDEAGNISPVYTSTITLDTVAPTGTVAINGGAAYATSAQVTLNLTLGAGVTDVVGVQFSNDNLTWSTEQAYSPSMSYTLSAGDGSKTVYVRFIDRAGNIGTAQDSITLDTVAPTGQVLINNNERFSNSLELELTLTTPDSNELAGIQFSSDGTIWSALEAYTGSKQWLVEGNGETTVYVKFIDEAGNEHVTSSSIYVDTVKPIVSISMEGGAELTFNDAVDLTIDASDAGRELETVVLLMELSHDGISWLPVESYTQNKEWTVSSGFGTKRVYVRIIDEASNVSEVAHASIAYRSIPQLNNSTVNALEDTRYSFAQSDFTYTNDDGIELDSYTLVSLPEHGVLKLGEEEIKAGAVVTAAQLVDLVYVPQLNWFGTEQFEWHASADGVAAATNAVLAIQVAAVNNAPVAENLELTKTNFSPAEGTLAATDIEGDTLTYYVVDAPVRGQVVLDENTGAFTFTLDRNQNGTYEFTYRVFDGTDYSDVATVTIKYSTYRGGIPFPEKPVSAKVMLKLGENEPEGAFTGQVNVQESSIEVLLTEAQLTQLSKAHENQTIEVSLIGTYSKAQLIISNEALDKLAANSNSLLFRTSGQQFILSNQELKQMLATNRSSYIISIEHESGEMLANAKEQAQTGAYQLIGDPITIDLLAQSEGDNSLRLQELGTIVLGSTGAEDLPSAVLKLLANGVQSPVLAAISIDDQSYQVHVTSYGSGTYTLIRKQPRFTDVSGWSLGAIETLASKLILSGVNETTFEPKRAITRAEFAAIISRALGIVETSDNLNYTDVAAGAWYSNAVAAVSELGFMNGYPDGTYRPAQQITREEAMVIVARVLYHLDSKKELSVSEIDSILGGYSDQGQIGSWSRSDIAFTVREGIIMGDNGKLAVKDQITREQVAAIIVRLLEHAEIL